MISKFRLGRFVNVCSQKYFQNLLLSGGYLLWAGFVFPLICSDSSLMT